MGKASSCPAGIAGSICWRKTYGASHAYLQPRAGSLPSRAGSGGEIKELVGDFGRGQEIRSSWAGQGCSLLPRLPQKLVAFAELFPPCLSWTTPKREKALSREKTIPLALGTAGRGAVRYRSTISSPRPMSILAIWVKPDKVPTTFLPIPDDKALLQVSIDEADLGKDYPIVPRRCW